MLGVSHTIHIGPLYVSCTRQRSSPQLALFSPRNMSMERHLPLSIIAYHGLLLPTLYRRLRHTSLPLPMLLALFLIISGLAPRNMPLSQEHWTYSLNFTSPRTQKQFLTSASHLFPVLPLFHRDHVYTLQSTKCYNQVHRRTSLRKRVNPHPIIKHPYRRVVILPHPRLENREKIEISYTFTHYLIQYNNNTKPVHCPGEALPAPQPNQSPFIANLSVTSSKTGDRLSRFRLVGVNALVREDTLDHESTCSRGCFFFFPRSL
jgi:hypothetical protein